MEGKDDRAVAAVWTLTMATIGGTNPLAATVMGVLAWLGPEALPVDVLAPLADDRADLDDALAVLASFSMIDRDGRVVEVHRLVQAVTRHDQQHNGTVEHVQHQVAQLLDEAIPADPINNVRGWPRWAVLLPHIEAFTAALPPDHRIAEILLVRDRAATYRQFQGQLGPAITGFERVLADYRRVLGENHPHTLISRNNLAYAYRAAGRLDEAITGFEQLLADRRRVLGEDHPNTLNLAAQSRQRLPGCGAAGRGDHRVRAGARRLSAGAG